MAQENVITGLILAGGEGRRVQGQDKGLLSWRGKKLIDHVADRLRPQVDHLIISCNRNIQVYEGIGDTQVQDDSLGFQGPLAGIEAAIPHVKSNILVITACDTPLLPLNLAQRLKEALDASRPGGTLISYAHDGKREQYLSCAVHSSLFPSLSAYLEEGNRAVRHWFRQHPNISVDFSDQPDAFQNFNSLETLSKPNLSKQR